MNLDALLWVASIAVIVWLIIRLDNVSAALDKKTKKHQKLQAKHDKLKQTLETRGRRLDVLLSTVTEVVLRVDKLGRVLGGNTQASDLFEFGKSPKLPQSLLLFYRDTEWMHRYQQAIQALPETVQLPEIKLKGRVFLPRLAALGESEALLLCMDVTAYTQLQKKQKSLLENLMHDLKTPLTSLLGYARSIEAFADDEALRKEATTVIAHEAKHINNLMNSMLTLNQIEHQKPMIIEPCDVVEVNQQVWESLHAKMDHKDVSLDLIAEDKGLLVKMAESDCHRILLNIADNALKFSPQGSVVQCKVSQEEEGACITVIDQGAGIADKHLKRVTERFYRVDHVRGTVKEEGHGLGLAIVKETLERDGGSLDIRNYEAGGLQVRISFP